MRPDLLVKDIRGNVDTRIKKLDDGQLRCNPFGFCRPASTRSPIRITQKFTSDEMLPAVGQAALGLETRSDDASIIAAVRNLDHMPTHAAVLAERTLLRSMRAGCLAPLACNAMVHNKSIRTIGEGLFTRWQKENRSQALYRTPTGYRESGL